MLTVYDTLLSIKRTVRLKTDIFGTKYIVLGKQTMKGKRSGLHQRNCNQEEKMSVIICGLDNLVWFIKRLSGCYFLWIE